MDLGSVQVMSVASPACKHIAPECAHTQRVRVQRGDRAALHAERATTSQYPLRLRAAMAIA
eukprot:15432634-Alexandrium_andersonii.AAC.1